ncbi:MULTISPECIES: hypothetical protein [unclassified Moorena]|uniref:hypothetical protein n=1 Tax=unclassified Moorena TaxID=2683338 RepID=UPI0013FF6BB0|nr:MULTISPECIES: hypothetical protein [unclassified Moorena]NEO17741.1 hypothetical protein [Moorena sp. SIO3E8]NEQ04127.1 hypothetical protein [Moorena sp. SIO3F7]
MGAWSCYANDLGQKATLREGHATRTVTLRERIHRPYPQLFRFFPIPNSQF